MPVWARAASSPGSLGQGHRLVRERPARSVSPCAVGGDGEVGGEAGPFRPARPSSPSAVSASLVVLLGGRPVAAPLVDPAELALDAGDVVGAGARGGPLEAGDGIGEAAVERLEVADRLVELGDRRVPQGQRGVVVRPGVGVGVDGPGVVAGSPEVLGGEVVAAGLPLVVRHRRPPPTPPVPSGAGAASSASATRWCSRRRRASEVWS